MNSANTIYEKPISDIYMDLDKSIGRKAIQSNPLDEKAIRGTSFNKVRL